MFKSVSVLPVLTTDKRKSLAPSRLHKSSPDPLVSSPHGPQESSLKVLWLYSYRADTHWSPGLARCIVGGTRHPVDNACLINRSRITTLYLCLTNIIKQFFTKVKYSFQLGYLNYREEEANKFCEVLISWPFHTSQWIDLRLVSATELRYWGDIKLPLCPRTMESRIIAIISHLA